MSDLSTRSCTPCEGGTQPLDRDQVDVLLPQIPGWSEREGGIERRFKFKNFHETMAFINALAWVAHQQDHHPDFQAGYRTCQVRFTTHAIGGLSENDFICAAKVNRLLSV